MPHCRDTSFLDPQKFNPDEIKERIGLTDKKIVMFLGTPRPHKGLDDLLEAFKKIKADDQAIVKKAVASAFKRLDDLNEAGNISAREALQKNGVIFDKPSGTEWRQIAKQALENLKALKAYPADTYQQLQQVLKDYRNSQQPASH